MRVETIRRKESREIRRPEFKLPIKDLKFKQRSGEKISAHDKDRIIEFDREQRLKNKSKNKGK